MSKMTFNIMRVKSEEREAKNISLDKSIIIDC